MKISNNQPNYEKILQKETAVIAYLDLSNMFHWRKTLKWNFSLEDTIGQILATPSVKEVKVYYGFDDRNKRLSMALHKRIRKSGGILRTKPVKYIRKTVDEALLIKKSTLTLFTPILTTKMTSLIQEIKQTGIVIEEPKCNFDVEMTMDLMDDIDKVSGVLLFSGDSDMAGPLERLKLKGKKAYVVGVRGMTSKELFAVTDMYIDFGKFYTGRRRK